MRTHCSGSVYGNGLNIGQQLPHGAAVSVDVVNYETQ